MTADCSTCGQPFERAVSPVCPPCRHRTRLDKQRAYEAAKRARFVAWLAQQPAEVQEAHRQADLEGQRRRYRRHNPLPPCSGCGGPLVRINQDPCDNCAPDREARQAKRERERARRLRLKAKETP